MARLLSTHRACSIHRIFGLLLSLSALGNAVPARAQDTPLISGGLGFFTNTNRGNTSYTPIVTPMLEAPLGQHFLLESRANLLETFSPGTDAHPGYTTSHFIGLSYLQLDYLATSHLTVVGGNFLTPFGTYNERLTPIWISNFQDGPLIFGIGTMGSGSGTGGMLRGSAISTPNVSVDYAAYFSANSTNEQFSSSRSTGGKVDLYFPKQRLEVGSSYGRLLVGDRTSAVGIHLWWEPAHTALKLRSEYAHGAHAQGYWIEMDYRLSHFGSESLIGRLEPVFRWQQAFRNSAGPADGLPSADTQRTDFGLDYRLPHEVRINTSYARQFSSTGNRNVWETGIVYRFLFPTWRGK